MTAAADDILWRPHPGQQTAFLRSSEYEVLYGGAAGAGKTGALLAWPLRYVDQPDAHAGIFRQTYPEIEAMVRESQRLYRSLDAKWHASKRQWRFPSGARVTFGNLEGMDQAYKYHGESFTMLLFDELASWPTDEPYIYLQSRLRRHDTSGCRLFIRATCNPTGPGKAWIQRRWKIPAEGTETRALDPATNRVRRFIPGRISDNPTLAGGEYELTLSSLPPAKRAALRDGRWDAMEGQYFLHLPVREFEPQRHWEWFGGFDWGNVHRTAFVLVGVDGDGHLWVVDTHSRARLPHVTVHAQLMRAMLARYGLKPADLYSIQAGHDCWAQRSTGKHEGTIAQAYQEEGFYFSRAKIDRIQGWSKLLELFGDPEHGLTPRLTIHPRCRLLIDSLAVLQHDDKRPEDVRKLDLPANDPDAVSDDEPDALRYVCIRAAQGGRVEAYDVDI